MEKKNLLFVAAALVMAGCASDDMIGDNAATQSDNQVIGFNMSTPAMTRGTVIGSTAAEKLGNKFFVWGEKNESKTTSTDHYAATAANTVFQNYTVKYGTKTANTTTSNTRDWEYVGLTDAVSSANLTPQTTVAQTIKYWDANAKDYTFTAVSANPEDITNSKVKIEKKTSATSILAKGYDITVTDMSAAAKVYVSDRVNIAQAALGANNPENAYGGYVNFTFRNFQSKVRFGIYEKVPGYKVVITKIVGKEANGDNSQEVTYSTESGKTNNFGVTGNFVVVGANTKYNVTYEGTTSYEASKTTVNRAKVTVADGSKTVDYLNTGGTNWLSTTSKNPVGTEATSPTWDNVTSNTVNYTDILPNPNNTTDMTLQVAYKLISEDTGEEIAVDTKEVKIPAEYCQWKPNFAYTYLFKITDKSAELYPITFDACVVEDETGKQETITTVSEPSITTFATRTTQDTNNNNVTNYVTGENEYKAGDAIYATVLEGGNVVTLSDDASTGNVKLYTVTTSDATNFPITEASVANAIATTSQGTKKITVASATGTLTTTVPAEDGSNITLANSGKALTWTPTEAATYAIEYTSATDSKKYYKVVKVVK